MVQAGASSKLIEAAPEEVGLSSAGLENVSRLIRGYVDDGKLPGVLAMIARRGKVAFLDYHGVIDAEAGTPVAEDSIFRFYSMTKPIASVALMQLYEQARFQLDDPVSRYIPQFKGLKVLAGGTADNYQVREAAREMTVRDLLMHTAGLSRSEPSDVVGQLYMRNGVQDLRFDGTLQQMIDELSELPLLYDPGSQWRYSIATDVVGYLCEVLSDTRFDVLLQERIFAPLGMVDTAFQVPAGQEHRFAANYRFGNREGEPPFVLIDAPATSPYTQPRSFFSGAAGLVSTAADYMRFCKMLANGGELDGARILGSRTVSYMAANHLPPGKDLAVMSGAPRFSETSVEGIGFGLGFAVLLDPTVAQVLGTPGEYYWGGAASTAFFINPVEDLILIFLTQLMPSSSYPLRRQLRAATYASIID